MKVNQTEIEVVRGSLQEQLVDGIVNIADADMRGGGGLDGAIHRAAGIDLIKELEKVVPFGAKEGDVVVTGAHKMPQNWVLHLALPEKPTEETLAQGYRACLSEAQRRGLETLAFPSLSAGAKSSRLEQSANLAVETVISFLQENFETSLRRVYFVMFGSTEHYFFKKILENLENGQNQIQ